MERHDGYYMTGITIELFNDNELHFIFSSSIILNSPSDYRFSYFYGQLDFLTDIISIIELKEFVMSQYYRNIYSARILD
jgi:hypothetical protein